MWFRAALSTITGRHDCISVLWDGDRMVYETSVGCHAMKTLLALSSGTLFGFGLAWSQMIDRERVINFLDVLGTWDATLLYVLVGAVSVTLVTFRWVLRQSRPLLATKFILPTNSKIDRPLVLGAAIFGVGWGLSGYCPGPGIAALVLGARAPIFFMMALLFGSLLHDWLLRRGAA